LNNGSGSQSRFIRTVRTPLEKRKRVRKMYGAFEDNNLWFYCWHCGAINNVDRNAASDGYGNQGIDFITYQDTDSVFRPQEQYVDLGRPALNTLNIEFFGEVGSIMLMGPDGLALPIYYTERRVEISKGCWFCGVTNIYGGQSN
jgi:hypothetical protein